MLDADPGYITDGGQVELLVPLHQFLFVGDQRHYLPSGHMDVEQFLCVVYKFFHFKNYTPLPKWERGRGKGNLFLLFFHFLNNLRFSKPAE